MLVLFKLIDQFQYSPLDASVTLTVFCLVLVLTFTFHEFSHAFSAMQLGDCTARDQGRLTLDPRAHLDPLGSSLILFAGFGWARPTPVNPEALRPGPRLGMALVSGAGPLSNIGIAMLAAVPINIGAGHVEYIGFVRFWGSVDEILFYVLGSLVFWNLLLASFNLIPLAPLDGFKIVIGVLPRPLAFRFAKLERYGQAPLLVLIILSFVVPGLNILSVIIRPILNLLSFLVLCGHIW